MGKKPGRTPEELKRFKTFADWYFTPKDKRDPPTSRGICAQLGVSEVTGIKWKHELEEELNYTSDEQKEFFDKTRELAYKRGNSRALEILGKAKGYINKKQDEEKVLLELGANDYYAILAEARTRVQSVQAQSSGIGSVPDELPVLPEEVREDTNEVEASEDGAVGELALPGRPIGSLSEPKQPDNSEGAAVGDIVAGSDICVMADSI